MSVFDTVRVVVYRYHEKGLEIFLINSGADKDPDVWKIPAGELKNNLSSQYTTNQLIELDPVQAADGNMVQTFAIEGDWHDIPSIRGLIRHDVKLVKDKIKNMVPDLEQGTFFAVKEAFKKVMPDEYSALKELKEILIDRNLAKYI
jgi:predicted NUDIX family NTP pyrophosphohydrolase